MTQTMSIADLTGDLVVYRDLQPCERGLPGLVELRTELGLSPAIVPRKRDLDYARVLLALLHHAREQRKAHPLQLVLVIGDTQNDRVMAAHLRSVSNLPVFGFIGLDQTDAAPEMIWQEDTATANRWALLDPWLDQVAQRLAGMSGPCDWSRAVLLLDIDKTLLGPRGRCDAPINEARAEGAVQVATDLLGLDARAVQAFESIYTRLCQSEYHGLTRDNQDYVVFITLLLASGALSLDALHQGMQDGSFSSFTRLLAVLESRIPPALTATYVEIRAADAAGDPTPFKAFRQAEFAATVGRMASGQLTLCREVVTVAQRLLARGVICVAASDKPAEASLPMAEQAAAGLQPLHRTPARVA